MNSEHDILRFGNVFGVVSFAVELGFGMAEAMEPRARLHFLARQLDIIGSLLPEFSALGQRLGYLQEHEVAWLSAWSRQLPEMARQVDHLDMVCTLVDRPGRTRLSTLLSEFADEWREFTEAHAKRFEKEHAKSQ